MIELRTLGTLELTSTENRDVSHVLAQPRRAALLTYLALAMPRGFQRRDTLLALFWPEYDSDQARHALRQSVYFLRRELGSDTIVSRGDDELALAPDQVHCDAWTFQAAIEQGRPADALALYRGELLAGFHISAAPDFERWLDEERSRLRQLAGEAGWALAAERERAGDAAGAVEAARRATALGHPDETALRRLMLLLERLGDRAAAVRAYETFTGNLKAEYELEPSAETQSVVARIRKERGGVVEAAVSLAGPGVAVASSLPTEAGVIAPERIQRSRAGKRVGILVATLAVFTAAGWAFRGELRPETPEIRRLAVLPLANLTGDERQEYFVDGMHEALVIELSQNPELTVISRQSTMQFRGTDRPVPAIARELGVDAVLEGSVFRAQDSVRITVQLIRADPERHVWAGTYHGTLRNALALQSEVARAVGRAIHARAAPDSQVRLAAPAVSPAAQEAYLQGLYHLERQMGSTDLSHAKRLEVLRAAVGNLEHAVALAPEWAAAHAKLARSYHWIASSFEELAPEFYPKSKAAALRALAIDPNEAQAHASLGFVLFSHEWDWEGAEREIQRALALDPNSHHWIYARFLFSAGRYDEAATHYRRAEERNPLSLYLKGQLAEAYSCAGRHDEAIAQLEELKVRAGDPPDWLRAAFGTEYLAKGRYREAIAALESAVAVSDSYPQAVALLAHGYAQVGRAEDSRRLTVWLEQRPAHWFAPQLYIALGDTGRAIAMIQGAFERRSDDVLHLRCESLYAALRNKPQIRKIVRGIGAPEGV